MKSYPGLVGRILSTGMVMNSFASFLRLGMIVVLVSGLLIQAQPVYAASLPAEINKQFTPLQINAGGVSVMRVTIFNPNSYELTGAIWADNLVGVQPGLFIANPAGIVTTCGGTVTALPGTTDLSLSGGTVPRQIGQTPGECYVEINVSSVTAGNLINTIPPRNLVSQGNDGGTIVNITNTTPASATITVIAVTPPSITKGFTPNTILVGQTSRLTITLNNNDISANLTGTSYTDTLPAGVVLANPVNATVTNCGPYSLTADPGGNTIAISGATVTPNQNCVVAVDVTGASGVYTNTIPAGPGSPGSIQTDQGVTNGTPASANLNIQPAGVVKSFSPANFQAGGTTTLTITLQNPSGADYTGVGISDTLPGVFVIANPANVSNGCGGTVTATSGTQLVELFGGTIPASGTPPTPPGTCTITVQVTAPVGSTASTATNIIPERILTADQPGVTNYVSATANISVYATGTGVGGAKSFTPATIDPGQNTRLRIDLTAPTDTNLTNFSITDNLPPGVTISNSTPATKSADCIGGTLSAPTGGTVISWTGGTINAGTRCRIEVYVTSNTPGVVTNRITPADITNNENRDPAGDITSNLTVRTPSDLTVSKAFYPNQVIPSGISTLTITLQNANALPIVNATATDNLTTMGTGGNAVRIAPVPNASTTCGGTLSAPAGGTVISLTGGTVPPQVGGIPGICTITVDIQAQSNTTTRTNTIPATNVSGEIQGTGTTINAQANATATLQTLPLTIGVVKGFNPVLVYGGASSTLSVRLINPNNATLSGIAFTDDMTLLGAGMEIANPANLNVGTCGGMLIGNPGDTSYSLSGGTLPPNTSCTVTLSVTMIVNGNLTNLIPVGAVTTLNGVSSQFPTQASLTNLPSVDVNKAFIPSQVLTGETATLTITITNTSLVPVVNMEITDGLPGGLPNGLEIANPANETTTCGGSLTATPASQKIQLVGGDLAGNASCVIAVDVLSTQPGVYVNTIPAGGLTADGGVANTVSTTDILVVQGNVSGLTKTIADSDLTSTTGTNVAVGEIVTYQVAVTVPPGTHTNTTLVDTMERGLAFVGCDTIDAPGLTTSVAGDFTSICSTPTTSDAGGGTPMDVDRLVTYSFGTLTNSGQTDQTLTITYRAIVLDIGTNLDGVNLNNSAVWNSSSGTLGPAQTTVAIVEPDMMIEKTANVNFIANGSEATFTLTVSHTSVSHSDAFDVVLADVLPAGLDFVSNSLDCDNGEQDPDAGTCIYDAGTRTISAIWSTFTLLPAGNHGIIQFRVVGNASIPANGSVTNTGSVAWSSMPGDQTTPTSFSNPPNSFATERHHDPANLVDLYADTSSLTLTPVGSGGQGGGGGNNNLTSSPSSVSASAFLIPVTGFAPNTETKLDVLARPLYDTTGLMIDIPVLKIYAPISGVQFKDGYWDVSWLQGQVGWLDGTAYPTWKGNSVLMGHVINADGKSGVFSRLKALGVGEYIFVYNSGYRYIYKVVSNKSVQPNDISVLKHEEKSYLTLITCDKFDAKTATYLTRIVVRAVLVDVQPVK